MARRYGKKVAEKKKMAGALAMGAFRAAQRKKWEFENPMKKAVTEEKAEKKKGILSKAKEALSGDK